MPGTFSQIYIHIVFAVQNRNSLITSKWEERLYQYITGVIRNKGQKLLAVNGMPDHVHILLGMNPSCSISDLVREVKKSSTLFIKENTLADNKFNWQEGFGAFSYSHSQIDIIIQYILNQKKHHNKRTFREEYIDLLKKFSVEHEEKYLFEWLL